MNALVGYTGFVGSNIYESAKLSENKIDYVFNSKNIKEAYGLEPDLLIYSGLRAEKYLANNEPQKDMELIKEAQENIRNINPKRLVLISTVDVLKNPIGADENSPIDTEGLQAYGYNRYQLECWVRKNYPNALIIRLPGLFGMNLKKNFIYDYIHLIPFMLKAEKYEQLCAKERELFASDLLLERYYEPLENGFYRCRQLAEKEQSELRERFEQLGFTALAFTDSRNVYQFYPLERLWSDIQIALEENILLWHPATEPVSAGEVYHYLKGTEFCNELSAVPVKYDYGTRYAGCFGGSGKYIMNKSQVLEKIAEYTQKACAEMRK